MITQFPINSTMRYHELIQESIAPAPVADIIKTMKSMANQKVIWRGMSGGTAYAKVINDRGGFYGGIKPEAGQMMKKLKVKNPSFGTYIQDYTVLFGTLKEMIPIKPYRALQSETITDLVSSHYSASDLAAASYSERMDLEKSEIVFDIKEYYLIDLSHALKQMWDPDDFAEHRIYPMINKAIKGIKTYQDIIDLLTKEQTEPALK